MHLKLTHIFRSSADNKRILCRHLTSHTKLHVGCGCMLPPNYSLMGKTDGRRLTYIVYRSRIHKNIK